MNYDKNTEEHVRVGFRLPPLFLGKPNDYNFATAVTAYMVAEAQVFQPERQTFDDRINKTLIKELGFKTLKFHSKPITLHDISNQMNALGIAKDVATRESFLDEINQMTGMTLQLAPEPQPDTVSAQFAPDGTPQTAGGRPLPLDQNNPQHQQVMQAQGKAPIPNPAAQPARGAVQKPEFQQAKPPAALPPGTAAKSPAAGPKKPAQPKPSKKSATELIDLAHDYAAMRGLVRKREMSEQRQLLVREVVDGLDAEDMSAFNSLLASYTFGSDSPDLVGITAHIR